MSRPIVLPTCSRRPARSLRRAFVPLVVAVSLTTLTGCNGLGGTTAATVEGHDISTRRVLALLQDRKIAADRQPNATSSAGLAGPGKDTFPKLAFSETLNQLVLADLLHRDLRQRHLSVTSADRTAARSSLEKSAGASTIKNLPEALRDFVVDLDATQAVLRNQVRKKGDSKAAQARAQYEQIKSSTPEQLLQLCVTGAVFTSKADATVAQRRLAGGATITAAVKGLPVQQVATTEQCAPASQLPAEVQKLGIGQTSTPIANQGTFVLLRLVRRKTLSFNEVRAQIEKNLPEVGSAELQAEIGKVVARAAVHVDPRFGRWNRQAGRVDPPAGTPTTTTPVSTPSAAAGGTGSSTPSSTPSGG